MHACTCIYVYINIYVYIFGNIEERLLITQAISGPFVAYFWGALGFVVLGFHARAGHPLHYYGLSK